MGKKLKKKRIQNGQNDSKLNHQPSSKFKLNSKAYKKCIRALNPNIFKFTNNDFFIYEPKLCLNFIDNLNDKNIIKPTENEISFLNKLINTINSETDKSIVNVLPFFIELMNNIQIIQPKLDNRAMKIKSIIDNWPRETNISIEKITQNYNEYALTNNQKIIHKSLVHLIIKNVLKYRYKKTTIKTSKLKSKIFIYYSFYFIKSLLRGLMQNMKLIFIDESGFFTKNSNYRTWRAPNAKVYFPVNDSRKVN